MIVATFKIKYKRNVINWYIYFYTNASFSLYIDNDTKDIQYWYGVFVVFVQTKHDTNAFMNDIVPLYNPVLNNGQLQQQAVYSNYFASVI